MNVAVLTDKISGDKQAVEQVLESIGCYPLHYDAAKRQFRFARDGGSNPSSVVLDLDTLRFYCFSNNQKGNLISLTMQRKGITFPTALHYIANLLNVHTSEWDYEVQKPFGGFFSNVHKAISTPEDAIPTYDRSILQPYLGRFNLRFLHDGIDFMTQKEFDVGYDVMSNRITVPQWTVDGELCGIMGRSNDPEIPHEYRWIPLLPCSRSLTVYGFHQNYETIQKRRSVLIFESEKAVMQCAAMQNKNAIAMCGCHISDTQAKYVQALRANQIVVCFDEGLDELFVREECRKLLMNNPFLHNRVGYVWDATGTILQRGSKQNAADVGHDKCKYLLQHNIKWIER